MVVKREVYIPDLPILFKVLTHILSPGILILYRNLPSYGRLDYVCRPVTVSGDEEESWAKPIYSFF
jgi:hypothetical protein